MTKAAVSPTKRSFITSSSGIHLHRVRAKVATDFINENLDSEVERYGLRNVQVELLLDSLAQVLGHADRRTLRRYVQTRLRRHAHGFAKLPRGGVAV